MSLRTPPRPKTARGRRQDGDLSWKIAAAASAAAASTVDEAIRQDPKFRDSLVQSMLAGPNAGDVVLSGGRLSIKAGTLAREWFPANNDNRRYLPPEVLVYDDSLVGVDVEKLNGGVDGQGRPAGRKVPANLLPDVAGLDGNFPLSRTYGSLPLGRTSGMLPAGRVSGKLPKASVSGLEVFVTNEENVAQTAYLMNWVKKFCKAYYQPRAK